MRSLLRTVLTGAALAAAAGSTPAWATANTYVFTSNYYQQGQSSSYYTLPDAGVTQKFTSTVGSTSLTATVSAWNMTKTGGSLATAQLGEYYAGLGVTSGINDNLAGCGIGSCNQHQIDNVGGAYGSSSIDFVQIVFSQAVVLTGITQVAYAQPNGAGAYVYDDDFSYGHSTSTVGALSTKTTTTSAGTTIVPTVSSLTSTQLSTMFATTYGGSGTCSSSTANNTYCYDSRTDLNLQANENVASTVWWVSAALLNPDSNPDAFKLFNFSVLYDAPTSTGAVPEPASWMTMIAGFGLIGGALRRRKAMERLAAA